jgi:hypothetical protein
MGRLNDDDALQQGSCPALRAAFANILAVTAKAAALDICQIGLAVPFGKHWARA